MPTSTLTGSWSTFRNANHGPWLINGALYALTVVFDGSYQIKVMRSTDGGTTWSERASFAGTSASGAVSGTTLHIADLQNITYSYRRFDATTDTIGAVLGSVDGNPQGGNKFAIAARSNGDVAILYQSTTSSIMGTAYRRVSLATYIGTTWTTGIAVVANDAFHYDAYAAVTGASDRIHLFFTQTNPAGTSRALHHRALPTSNTLAAVQAIVASGSVSTGTYPVGIASGDGTSISVPYVNASGVLTEARAASADSPTWTTTATISTTGNHPETTNSNPAAMVHIGSTRHAVWVDDAQTSISKSAWNGTSWATATTVATGIGPVNGISAGTDGTDLYVLYDNNGTVTLDYPASGPTVLNASGSTAGTSTVAASAKLALTASASSAGTSSVTGAATQGTTLTASGTSAGTSTVTGNATQGATFTASATSAGTSTVSGSVTYAAKLAGTSTGTSTVAGAATVTAKLAGTSTGTSTVAANATMATVLLASGTSAGTSTVTGTATQGQTLLSSASTAGTSTVSGAANLTAKLAGTSAGTATVTANTTLATRLLASATSAGAGSVTGSARMAATASGAATGTSTVTGNATLGATLVASATSDGISTAAATASAGITATGSSAGTSTVAGAAKIAAMLTATSAGTSAVTGDAFTSATLPASGTSAGTSAVAGGANVVLASAASSVGSSTVSGNADTATAPSTDAFVHDTFTGTNGELLNAHTGEVGATWTRHAGEIGQGTIASNRLALTSNGIVYASGVPNTAEYDVEVIVYFVTAAGLPHFGGRISTSTVTGYFVRLTEDGGAGTRFDLFRTVNGASTSLGTYSDATINVGESFTVVLSIRDDAKRVLINGVERISSVDNTITDAGRVGVRATATSLTTTGWHIDSIRALNVYVPVVTVSGASAGTSSVTGNALATEGVAASGTSAGTSTVTGSAKIVLTATGSAAGTSTVTGSAKIVLTATGSAAGTSTVSGSATQSAIILRSSGTAQGSSSAAAVARMGLLVAASATGGSVVDEPYAVLAMVTSGSAAGVATCAGLVTGARRFWTTAQLVE